jgi:pimeloyl-ACP methyl ester carboxylesterase
LLCGEFDEVTPATTRQVHDGIPRSVFVVMAGCSHMSQAEQPDAVLGLVGNWFAGRSVHDSGRLTIAVGSSEAARAYDSA